MIVLATGSSKWTDKNVVWEVLDETYEQAIDRQAKMTAHQKRLYPFETGIQILYGMCPTGADFFVEEWMDFRGGQGWIIGRQGFPADWTSHSYICPPPFVPHYEKHIRYSTGGKPYCPSAGIKRNIEMVAWGEAHRYRLFFNSICLAWCLNDSTGTVQCARRAKRCGYELRAFRQGTQAKKL